MSDSSKVFFSATEPLVVENGDRVVVHYHNEGLQIHPVHLHGFSRLVAAKDGYPLDEPYWVDTLNVAPTSATRCWSVPQKLEYGFGIATSSTTSRQRMGCSGWLPR